MRLRRCLPFAVVANEATTKSLAHLRPRQINFLVDHGARTPRGRCPAADAAHRSFAPLHPENDVFLLWDHFSTIHRAIADYRPDEIRLIRRCQLMATKVFDPAFLQPARGWSLRNACLINQTVSTDQPHPAGPVREFRRTEPEPERASPRPSGNRRRYGCQATLRSDAPHRARSGANRRAP